MPDGLILVLIVATVLAALLIPFRLPVRKAQKAKRRYGNTFGAAMSAINEIYLPSAHQAGQIVEEMKVARTAIPGAPDPLEKTNSVEKRNSQE
jgi:hypothetical protein